MCLSGTFHALHHEPNAPLARPDRPVGRFSRRGALVGAAATAVTVAVPAAPAHRRHGSVRDLTHAFRVDFPIYGGDPPGRRTVATIKDTGFYVQAWSFAEHVGTHLDAPGHVVPGGRLVPELDPEEMFAPLAVVDISRRAEHDPDAMVEVRDLRDYERSHGPQPHVVGMVGPLTGRDGVVDTDPRLSPPGRQTAHLAQHERAQLSGRRRKSRGG